MMAPYVWPKGSLWRQAIVLLSLVLLGVLRGINVLVPLYNKYIGMFDFVSIVFNIFIILLLFFS